MNNEEFQDPESLLKDTLEILNKLEIALRMNGINNYGGMYGFDDKAVELYDFYNDPKMKLKLLKNQIDRILQEDWDTLRSSEDEYYSSECW